MQAPPIPLPGKAADIQYRNLMARELLIWLIGVPVPIAALIGLFVL